MWPLLYLYTHVYGMLFLHFHGDVHDYIYMNLQSHVYSPKKLIQLTKYILLHISAIADPEGLSKSQSVFQILIQCISNPEQTPPAVVIPCDCICPCLHFAPITGTHLNKNWQIFMSMSESICICLLYGAFLKTMTI